MKAVVLVTITLMFMLGCQSKTNKPEMPVNKTADRTPQSLGDFSEVTDDSATGDETFSDMTGGAFDSRRSCFSGDSPHFASNEDINLNGKTYPSDTQFSIYKGENGYEVIAHLKDGSGSETDAEGSYDTFNLSAKDLDCSDFTSIPVNEDENGDMVLGEYSLPKDLKFAGKGKKRKRKGVTYCYREVKRIVRRKIKLTGASAYMANAQLKRAKWRRYSSYKSAPNGSICVFGPGGKRTASGGHKHGHIGIKGRGGVVNPLSGFKLKRPFWGCYYK